MCYSVCYVSKRGCFTTTERNSHFFRLPTSDPVPPLHNHHDGRNVRHSHRPTSTQREPSRLAGVRCGPREVRVGTEPGRRESRRDHADRGARGGEKGEDERAIPPSPETDSYQVDT